MTLHLNRLKSAALKLHTLRGHLPTLEDAFNHRLRARFPRIPRDSRTQDLHINHPAPPEPGQSPVLISRTISSHIEECFSTQSTPTFVQGSTHVYSHAYSLIEQQRLAGLPPADLESYLEYVIRNYDFCARDALAEFWQTPHAAYASLAPQQWLTQCLTDLVLDEAAVRLADQTLSRTAVEAIQHFFGTQAPVPQSQAQLTVYEVFLKAERPMPDIKLAGTFVIADKTLDQKTANASSQMVLYTPDNGIEAFDSLQQFTHELHARLKDPYQRAALLRGVLAKEQTQVHALEHVTLVATDRNAPELYTGHLIDKLAHDVMHACALARRGQTAGLAAVSPDTLFEQIEQALTAGWFVNPAAILRARYARLFEQQLPQWLKTATDDEKAQWRLATNQLIQAQEASESLHAQPIAHSGKKQTLLEYAKAQLKQQVNIDLGIEINPDAVYVLTTEAIQTGPVIYPIFGSAYTAGNSIGRTGPSISYKTTRLSLTQLALSNVGVWDVTFALTAQIIDVNGAPHARLTKHYVKGLVRTVDVGERYKAHLNEMLVNSAQAGWRKERYVALRRAQLQLDMLEARLAGTLSPDQAARIQAVLDQPGTPLRAPFRAHLLQVNKNLLPGVLVFSSTDSTDLLCYLPDAPDKTWFVVAHSRSELGQMLSRPTLHNYLQQRVTSASWPYLKPLLKTGLDTATVQLPIIPENVFEASYNNEVSYAFRDADEQTTSTYESNVNTAKEAALAIVDVVSFVLPTKFLLPLVAARFVFQVAQGVDALKRDEEHEAFLHFMGAISHVTDGVSDFAGSAVFARAIRQRVKSPAPRLNAGAASQGDSTGLTLRTGAEYGAGVYESTSGTSGTALHYVEDAKGHRYRARYDSLDTTWRIIDERHPGARHQTPVRELSAGRWDVDDQSPLLTQNSGITRLIKHARVSDIDLSAHSADAHGIYQVSDKHYIEQSGLVFEVYKGWMGRHWYLKTPLGTATVTGPFKVRLESRRWEIKSGSGAQKRWEPLTLHHLDVPVEAPASLLSEYDVPAHVHAQVQNLIAHHPRLLDAHYFSINPEHARTANFFTQLRLKLFADAQTFFAKEPVKPRPTRPALPVKTTPDDLFRSLFEESRGIVIGESHSDLSAKKVLIKHMGELAAHDVKVIYLEHLQTDLHQSMLDDYAKTGKMPPALKSFLKDQDRGHQLPASSDHTYSQLVREARRHGLEIVALDCMASYNPQGMNTDGPNIQRHAMFSYFASQVIRTHQAKNGGQKWIALTGNTHANRFKGVPGLAELEGVIGVRVSDSASGSKYQLRQNISQIVPKSGILGHNFLKNDYWLEVKISGAEPIKLGLTPEHIEAKLHQPGLFLFDNAPHGGQIIHRSTSNEIIRTPIRTQDDGQFYIDRPGWGSIHQKRYDFLVDLKHDLHRIGVRLVH